MRVIVVLLKVFVLGIGLVLIAAGLFCGAIGFSGGTGMVPVGLIGLGGLALGGVTVYALLRSFKRKVNDPETDPNPAPPKQP